MRRIRERRDEESLLIVCLKNDGCNNKISSSQEINSILQTNNRQKLTSFDGDEVGLDVGCDDDDTEGELLGFLVVGLADGSLDGDCVGETVPFTGA